MAKNDDDQPEQLAPQYVFHTSAWIGYLRGDPPELEAMAAHGRVLTSDLCLVELATCSDQARRLLKFIEYEHEVVPTTAELATAAAAMDHDLCVGERLTIAIAVQEGVAAVFLRGGRVKRLAPEEARRFVAPADGLP